MALFKNMLYSSGSKVADRQSRHSAIVFLIICSAFAIVAGGRLEYCHLWIDEIYSIMVAQRPLNEIWSMKSHSETFYWNTFPPFYETVLHFIWHPSGESALLARWFSIAFSLGALAGIYRLTKLCYGTQAAVIASFLLGFNFMFIYYSMMIRGYALFNFLSIWSMYTYFKIYYQKKKFLLLAVRLFVLNAALLYTSYLSFYLIVMQMIFAIFLFSRKVSGKMLIVLCCSIATFYPWLNHFYEDFAREPAIGTAGGQITHVGQILLLRLGWGMQNQWLVYSYLIVLVLSIIAACWSILRHKKASLQIVTLCFSVLVLVMAILFTWITRTDVSGHDMCRVRYYFPFLFPLFILTGAFICRLPRVISLIVLIFFIVCVLSSSVSWSNVPKSYFWPVEIHAVAEKIKEFPFPAGSTVAIELSEGALAPAFMYSMFGNQYFFKTGVPYAGANLEKIFFSGNVRYRVWCNYVRKHRFWSIPRLQRFDWLCLVYSERWPVKILDEYKRQLSILGLESSITLVARKNWNYYCYELYKVNLPQDYGLDVAP